MTTKQQKSNKNYILHIFAQPQYSKKYIHSFLVSVQIRHLCADNLSDTENTSILPLQIDTRVQSTRILDNGDNGRSYLHSIQFILGRFICYWNPSSWNGYFLQSEDLFEGDL